MINYLKWLFTFASIRIEQHESVQMPGVPEIVRVDMYFNSWKLALLCMFCALMGSTISIGIFVYALSLVSR